MSLSPCSNTELGSNRQTLSLEEKTCNQLYKMSSLAHPEEFPHGRGAKALAGAARGGLESPSEEWGTWGQELGLGTAVLGEQLDSMVLKVFVFQGKRLRPVIKENTGP